MPRKIHTPTYRIHKSTGQAVVTINGQEVYLGKHGSEASWKKYGAEIKAWAEARNLPAPSPDMPLAVAVSGPTLTVGQLALLYLAHADSHYRHADGTPTSEPLSIRQAMRPLNRLYARLPAAQFSPLKLEAVREEMVRSRWTRKNLNRQVKRLQQMFRWGVSKELIPATVHQSISTIAGLRVGYPGVAESPKVESVPQAAVDAVLPHLSPTVAAMVRVQLLTGMRPGELLIMRTADLEMDGNAWTFRPATHKTAHRGKAREIPLGPKAREILRPMLRPELKAFLFNPSEAEAQRSAERRQARQTPLTPSQKRRDRYSDPATGKGDVYTVCTYRRAIARACDKAFPLPAELEARYAALKKWRDHWTYHHKNRAPKLATYPPEHKATHEAVEAFRTSHRWHPHQLRHSAATALKKRFGREDTRAVLGHSSVKMGETYIDEDTARVREIMEVAG